MLACVRALACVRGPLACVHLRARVRVRAVYQPGAVGEDLLDGGLLPGEREREGEGEGGGVRGGHGGGERRWGGRAGALDERVDEREQGVGVVSQGGEAETHQ